MSRELHFPASQHKNGLLLLLDSAAEPPFSFGIAPGCCCSQPHRPFPRKVQAKSDPSSSQLEIFLCYLSLSEARLWFFLLGNALPCANSQSKRNLRCILELSALHLPILNRESLYISIGRVGWFYNLIHQTRGRTRMNGTHIKWFTHTIALRRHPRARVHTHTKVHQSEISLRACRGTPFCLPFHTAPLQLKVPKFLVIPPATNEVKVSRRKGS